MKQSTKPLYKRPLIIAAIILGCFILFILLLNNVIMPLYVRSGEVAIVPTVQGLDKDNAIQKLKDAGFDPIVYEVRFDDKVAQGVVIRQTPEPAEETKPGRKVYLIISGGKEMEAVPNLIGRPLRDAKIELLKQNLSSGTTSYSYSDSIPSGIVLSQNPPSGSKISSSTRVDLVVSQGSLVGRVPVPDLRKMTLADAIAKLNASQLMLGNVSFQSSPDAAPNTVIEQYPNPGDLVNEQSSIDLFVVREKTTPSPNAR